MPKLENASIHWVSLQSGAGRSSRHCRHTPACYAPSPPPTGDPMQHNFMHCARTVHSWWSKSHPIESAASIAFLSTSYYSYICFWPSPLYNCSQFSVCLYASILRSFDFSAEPIKITNQNTWEIASASASACQLIIQIPEKWFNTKRERFESCVASMKSIGWIRLKVYLINWTKTNKELAVLFGERKLPLSKVIKDKGGLFFTFFTHILVAKNACLWQSTV